MFKKLIFLASLMASAAAFAQKTAVTDIPSSEAGTTISVQKGITEQRDYDILSGTGEIAGDSNVLLKGARDSWKTACADWKKEIKDLNKENLLIAINCNSPKCATETNGTVCTSTGSYQVRVKIKK